MATGTVADERRERKRELARAKDGLAAAMADCPESHPALGDRRVRRAAVSAGRLALEAAYRADRTDGVARACAECGERMRLADREESPVETLPGRVRVSIARHGKRLLRDDGAPARVGTGHRGFDDVGVCIGDGAAWLRRLFGERSAPRGLVSKGGRAVAAAPSLQVIEWPPRVGLPHFRRYVTRLDSSRLGCSLSKA